MFLLTGTNEFWLVQAINTFAAVITQAVLTVTTSPFTLSLWKYLICVTVVIKTCIIMSLDFLYNIQHFMIDKYLVSKQLQRDMLYLYVDNTKKLGTCNSVIFIVSKFKTAFQNYPSVLIDSGKQNPTHFETQYKYVKCEYNIIASVVFIWCTCACQMLCGVYHMSMHSRTASAKFKHVTYSWSCN